MVFGLYEKNMSELEFDAIKIVFNKLSYELKDVWFKKHETDYDIMYIEITEDEKSTDLYNWYDIFTEFRTYRKGMFINEVDDKNFLYVSKV